MSELCLDCLNKILKTNNSSRKYILSWGKDICEECGEYKRVVIRMKMRYILVENIREWVHDLRRI